MNILGPQDKILTSGKRSKEVNYAELLSNAAAARGVSQVKIAMEIFRHALARQRLAPKAYFQFGLFRPELTDADRFAFVSENEITRLNRALWPDERYSIGGIINRKTMTELLFRGAGLPCSTTIAVARASKARLPFRVLNGAEAIEHFLREEGRLPIFGKPDDSSLGVGAASFMCLEGEDIVLGDGTSTPLRKLCQEIARDYPAGYVFQKLLVPHGELAKLIGPVIGTMRVLSLRLKQGPAPLFVMLKMPGPNAMVDGALSGSNAAAIVDPLTGRIQRAQLLSEPLGKDLTHGHVTGAQLPGAVLPDFERALNLALDAHRLFPDLGVLGSDVMLSDQGPLINEVNLNPLASLVQNALGRGLFDESFKQKYREALEVQGATLPIRGVRL